MNSKLIGTALGALMLCGTTLASAHGLDDLFRILPHPEFHADRDRDYDRNYNDREYDRNYDRDRYMAWHRESRWERHDGYRDRDEHRFESRRYGDRDDEDHGWRGHDRYER